MKKWIGSLLCFFYLHDWTEETAFAFEVTRECKRCGQVEYLYMGHWIPYPKK